MARSSKSQGGLIDLNLTPMIDCVFQLILFFILTSQVASQLLAPVQLAHPLQSKAISEDDVEAPHKVIVNVVSAEGDKDSSDPMVRGRASMYKINNKEFRTQPIDMDALTAELRTTREQSNVDEDTFFLEIRGDRKVHFAYFEPVMIAAGDAGIRKMNISAQVD